jgi:ATP-dependent DNA ligase
LLSRHGRNLGPWFPELTQAGESLPVATLIDGEIVIADDDGCVDFTALEVRLSSAHKQVSRTAFERAAVLVVFDALEIDGFPLADEPLVAAANNSSGRGHSLMRGMRLPGCGWSAGVIGALLRR